MSDKLQLVESNHKLKFVEQPSGATLGTVLDGCDGGAVADGANQEVICEGPQYNPGIFWMQSYFPRTRLSVIIAISKRGLLPFLSLQERSFKNYAKTSHPSQVFPFPVGRTPRWC